MSTALQVVASGCLALVTIALVTVAAAAHAALNAKAGELTSRSAQILKHAGLLDDPTTTPKP